MIAISFLGVAMDRTRKDILILGRTKEEVKSTVTDWFAKNSVSVTESSPNHIKGRWGVGFLTAPKYFQVSFQPSEDGILAKTEGWITIYGLKDHIFPNFPRSWNT